MKSVINQFIAVFTCAILTFICGQTVGWMSAAIAQLEDGGEGLPSGKEGLDPITSGWIGGALCLGAFIFAPIHGVLADWKGRKFAAYFVGICFTIHWLMLTIATDMIYIFLGRALGGVGGAGAITIFSIYSNEVADDKIRGTLGSILPASYTLGTLISYMLGAFTSLKELGIIHLAISIAFFLLWWMMPETPRYLVLNGHDERAIKAIMWLRKCTEDSAKEVVTELKIQQKGAVKPATIKQFFQSNVARYGLFLTSVLVALHTFSGIFAINSFATSIFKRANTFDPFTSTIIYGGIMFIGAMVPTLFVEKLGRKLLLTVSYFFMTIGMGVLATYFLALKIEYFSENDQYSIFLPIVALCECVLACYMGVGSVTYIMMVELFSDETRGIAGSILATISWSTSFILLQFFKPAVDEFGDFTVFYFFTFVCMIGIVFIYVYIPETKGKTFPEIMLTFNLKENNDTKCSNINLEAIKI